MKNKMKYLFLFIITALIFAGCQDRTELVAPSAPSPVSGNANLTTYVAIGNSLTAGYQSSALYQSAQVYSYPNQIAQQVGATFEQPLIADPGIGGQIKIVSLDPFVTKTEPLQGGAPLNLNYPAPYNNLGIPGIVLADVADTTVISTANSYSHSPFIDIILRGQGYLLAQAKALHPSFISLWIGNNDVLGFATSGGADPSSPTDATTFGYLYGQLADYLAATGAKIVVANIPNVTAIPFFTTIGPGFYQSLTAAGATGFYYQSHGQYSGTVASKDQLINFGQPTNLLLTLISQPYLAYFGKPSGKFYRDHNADISLLIAGGIIDTTKPFGADPKNPIPDALILDPSEISTANTATANFNAAIQAAVNKYPNQFALVDINGFFNSVAANGITENGVHFTTTFVTGGLFSLDGVHPTAQGQAIIANEFLKVINSKFGSTYSLIDVSTIPGSIGLAKIASINFADKNTFIDPGFKKYLMF